jgi:tRNA modification GTPase
VTDIPTFSLAHTSGYEECASLKTSTTIVRLTSTAPSAISVLRLAGPECDSIACQIWTPNQGTSELALNQIRFGYTRQTHTGIGESIVVCRTSSETIEIHCHGGAMAARALIEQCVALGAVEMNVWESRSSLVEIGWGQSGTIEREAIEREALEDLTHAITYRTTRILLDQARGSLAKALEEIEKHFCSGMVEMAMKRLDRLLYLGQAGLHLIQPFRVVLAGPPNVGKSSLLNRLLGYSRAIVHEEAGTTRDLLRERTSFDGWPVELVDSAGVRELHAELDAVEQEGMARSMQMASNADCVLLLVSFQDGWTTEHDRLLEKAQGKVVIVQTKKDLGSPGSSLPSLQRSHGRVITSSITGEGLQSLMDSVVSALIPSDLKDGEAVPFRKRHLAQLQQLRMLA